MKSWYSAKLLYESQVPLSDGESPLCEESIRVLRAENEAEAKVRAAQSGLEGEHSYSNEAGQTVNWVFISVLEIQDLCEATLEDGTEVFSRLFRKA